MTDTSVVSVDRELSVARGFRSVPFANLVRFASGLILRLLVFASIVAICVVLPRLMPGNTLEIMLSTDLARGLTPAEVRDLQENMGLGGDLFGQVLDYTANLLNGDLGYSIPHAAPVGQLLIAAFPWTGLLILGAAPIFLIGGALAGIEAGRMPGQGVDRWSTPLITVMASLPPFVGAVLLLLVFGVLWPILPTSGAQPLFPATETLSHAFDIARHAVLPSLALALHELARFFFLARAETIHLAQRDFVVNARARGVSVWRIRWVYIGRSLVPAYLARLSDTMTGLISAVFFVEIVFSYPGTGYLIYSAILERDYDLLQGTIVFVAGFVLLVNWCVDGLATRLAERG
ncbi:ABC transporter permease [Phaeobacter porticola]|uniref:ABC transporter, integral inner membrane component n=1 Tax=Phaeobacter porticola TaxID=1844006 RepID=A0A1L3I9X0_9RHOB|nr:ABC transporter permease [Phaeobacter porticola]APG48990.1 ABC transporter, integral inner membrane component [Phaeobacter porticola]